MDNKVLATIFGGIALLCVTILGVAFMVTSGDDAPAPSVTATAEPSTPAPVETSDPILDILEETWNEQSSSDQESLCWLFNVAPDEAWNSFNSGSEGLLPRETFDEFFAEQC
jgi:hypothetical protein